MMTSPEGNRPPIRASLCDYKGQTMIRLDFPYDSAIIKEVKAIRGRVWSVTNKCWYVPDTGDNRRRYGLSDFEQSPNLVKEGVPSVQYQTVCQSLLEGVRNKIILKGYSQQTFYLPCPEKPLQLPKVLGEHELERMFRSVTNLKHKTILLTAFSCGLRVGEVVKLKYRNIDMERMQVFIERSKGKKDRYITLSPILKDILCKYVEMYKIKPPDYLFEGQEQCRPYSARSAQIIFNRAAKATGIHKKVTFHALRHSYATHLLEKEVDIKYIKELLGHFDIKTTERYLHVAKEKLVNIQSPLDYLDTGI